MLRLAGMIEYSFRHSSQQRGVRELPKWRYFLYQTSAMHNSNSVRPDSLVLNPGALFTKLRRNEKRNLNDVYHRFHKVRALLAHYYKDDLSPSHFLREMNFSMNYLATNLFDYKFGQFYEERVLLIFVDNIRILEKKGSSNVTIAGYFLNYLLYKNITLSQKINSVKDDYPPSQNGYHLYFKQYGQDSSKKYQYPHKLLHFMDRDVNYTSQYNKNSLRKPGQLINGKFQKKKPWDTIQREHRQELSQILNKEAPLLDNCKMSRLDYLCTVEYLVSRKTITKGNIKFFYFYVQEDRKAKLASESGPTQFLQNMILLNILGHLDQMTPQEKKNYKEFKYSHSLRQNYFAFYLKYLQNITPAALLQLLTHSSELFPKYLVQNYTLSMKDKIEKAYIRIIDIIFDWYQQGDLLESNVNIAPFMEILLQMNSESVIRIMKKFEICLLKKNQVIKKSIMKDQMVPYYVMMKHGLKSDIMADQLLESTQKWWISNQQQTNELLFRIQIVLSLLESDDHPQKDHLQQLFISKLLSMEIWEPKQNKTFLNSAKIEDFVASLDEKFQKNYLHLRISQQNEVSKICKFLFSLFVAIKISKKSSLFDSQKEEFTQKLTKFMQLKRQKIIKFISYPRLLKHLFSSILEVGSENEKYFLLGLLSNIQQIIEEEGQQKCSLKKSTHYQLLIESPKIESISSERIYSIQNITSVVLYKKILYKKRLIKKSLNIDCEEEKNCEQEFDSLESDEEDIALEKEQERELSGQDYPIQIEELLTEAPLFRSERKTSRKSPFFKRRRDTPTESSTSKEVQAKQKEQGNTQSANQAKENKNTKIKATRKRTAVVPKKKSKKIEKEKFFKSTKKTHQKNTLEEKQQETSPEVNEDSKGQVAPEKLRTKGQKRKNKTPSVTFQQKDSPFKKQSSRFLNWIAEQSLNQAKK